MDGDGGVRDSFPLLSPSKIRVLVVPVSTSEKPLSSSEFRRCVDLMSQFGVVPIRGEKGETERCLYLDLVTAHHVDHVFLEDFQLHTRVMGVIGIAHCDDIQDSPSQRKYLADASRTFVDITKRYPSSLVHRCLAFNPSKETLDNPLKDIYCVPNEGPLSFYLASFMNVFASELLRSFTILTKQIEARPLILGPTAPNFSVALKSAGMSSASVEKSDNITVAGATAGGSSSERNKKRTPSRAMKLIADLNLLAGKLDLALQGYQRCIDGMKETGDYMWWAAALESYQAAYLLQLLNTAGIGSIPTSPVTVEPGAIILHVPTTTTILASPALLTYHPLRTFLAETPDRHRQIMHLYERANAAAVTGGGSIIPILAISVCLRVARVLRGMWRFGFAEYIVGGAGLNLVAAAGPGGAEGGAGETGGSAVAGGAAVGIGKTSGPGSTGPNAGNAANDRIVFNNGIGANKLDISTWLMKSNYILSGQVEYVSMPDRVWAYSNIAAVYGSIGFRRKHAFFLREMGLVISETLRPGAFHGIVPRKNQTDPSSNVLDAWKRESMMHLEEGEFYGSKDGGGLRFTTETDTVTGKVDTEKNAETKSGGTPAGILQTYKRVCEVFGLQIRGFKSHVPHTSFLQPTFSDDEEEWLEEYENENDLQEASTQQLTPLSKLHQKSIALNSNITASNNAVAALQTASASHVRTTSLRNLASMALGTKAHAKKSSSRQRFGWPALQIQVLQECVQVSEALDDHPYAIYFIVRLLRRLKKHLLAADQQNLSDRLEAVMLKTFAASGANGNDVIKIKTATSLGRHNEEVDGILPVMVRGVAGGVAGIPVLRTMEIVAQPQALCPLSHPSSWLVNTRDAKDIPKELFLYNPTAVKGRKKKITLVANELVYVDIVLANPFAFDLDLKSISLCTSGVPFKPASLSTVIPAFARKHQIRIYGSPMESGTLSIHGCTVRLFGGCLEEEIYPLKKVMDDPKRKGKDGKLIQQDERERFGKRLVSSGSRHKSDAAHGPDRTWAQSLPVLPSLPLMKVSKGSQIGLGAMMLFEGERSSFTLELENIGSIPINYLRISFVENTTPQQDTLPPDAVEDLETVYERDIYEYHLRAFWFEKLNGASSSNKEQVGRGTSSFTKVGAPKGMEVIDVALDCGESATVTIGVFGKRMCTGGVIAFEYGNVVYPNDRPDSSPSPDTFSARQALVPILLSVEKPLEACNLSVFHINNRDAVFSKVPDRENVRAISLDDLLVESSGSFQETTAATSVIAGGFSTGHMLNNEYFVLSFDLRNCWSLPFDVHFDIYDDGDVNSRPAATVSAHLYPGTTKRILVPVKRIYIPESQMQSPIPVPTWKQFVVGRSKKMSWKEDRFRRQAFWLREALVGLGVGGAPRIDQETGEYTSDLVCGGADEDIGSFGRIVAHWNSGRGRIGRLLGLRGLDLKNEDMIDAVVQEEVSLSAVAGLWSEPKETKMDLGKHITPQNGRIKVKLDTFINFEWKVRNNGYNPLFLCLRIQPVFGEVESRGLVLKSDECDSRIVVSGTLESPLPTVLTPRGGCAMHQVMVMFLSRGIYTLVAHAEEVGLNGDPENIPQKKSKKDKDIDAVALGLVGSAGRVFWGREVVVVEVE
ncbi:hypothetical protein HDU80_000600 [Chytriomyces hyalinus]|nr:hypothetical protein HDU80_000600 [Chytriomyces hyalinus]